ncbi:ricin-type beta-trefoil lectin domain protein [Streptomyces macrosporus]|uniref:RICIN domain-containing protein n=1 Tax=Streptomyces macrosporus TaxID=44032 RepID=A0ABN3J5C4_9ACTN
MSELDHADRPVTAGTADAEAHTGRSDAELTELLRTGRHQAGPAARELRRRHLPAVPAYARLCGGTRQAGDRLCSEAFALGVRQARQGRDPREPWRHHLMLLVHTVAARWAAEGHGDRLRPDFAAWLDGAGALRSERAPALLAGYRGLPGRTRGVLWYGVVDEEADRSTGTLIGVEPHEVAALRARALDALGRAYLGVRLKRRGEPRCHGFRRIIEVSVAEDRHSGDLDEHLATCPCCGPAVELMRRMRREPRTVLADGLLLWGGADHLAQGPFPVPEEPGATAPDRPPAPEDGDRPTAAIGVPSPEDGGPADAWPDRARRLLGRRPPRPWAVAVLGCAVTAAVLAAVLTAVGGGEWEPADGGTALPAAPRPTVAVTATVSPSPSAPPDGEETRPPARSQSPTPPAGSAERRPTTAPAPPPRPGEHFAPLVNAASGLCLDIADGVVEKRADVLTARCGSAPTQRWRLDERGLLHSYADPSFCLDSRGDTDRGVGIWPCSSVDGDNGENLLFVVDGLGVIRPRIAPDFALSPSSGTPGGPMLLEPAENRGDQRWTVGRP